MEPMGERGRLHPITETIREIYAVFCELGFEVALGPELEFEYYNFDALNIPADHPSRDMQDTFWLKEDVKDAPLDSASGKKLGRRLLTTQTSAVQIRFMEAHKPPFRVFVPGKVFRNEATDATHGAEFHQVEGLLVERRVSLAQLIGTLEHALKKLFGDKSEMRFRPSYFPFVEPAIEVDLKWKDKWLEIVGAGLVHPQVLRAGGVDPKEWQGFAFALGIDRLVMLKHAIPDVRMLYGGDLRFINQF